MGWLVLIVTAWAACGTSSEGLLVGGFGPWGAGFGGGGFIGGGVGALSLGGQRHYAQRLVCDGRPGTRLQHIAYSKCILLTYLLPCCR